VGEAVEWAKAHEDIVRLVTPADAARRGCVLAIAPRDPVAASRALSEANIYHSLREGAIRLSPHGYNTSGEMQKALELMGGQR
jgi:cysteine desulfurase / selenocysteine lyase